ncbi:hypothetical protein SAMN05444920_12450 [Nonomuraea solani]|uniref:Uncharacterized protein n=1 Tax=Nonomuraea solani TaxID=1144553 RepID=A0A1H6EYV4_9ACTN|nr:hypothetical protein [Nonomuraea solani]SEH02115.1 hypothetical protein SAMN05444920_12450 [Nonomuraea solani]
MATLIDRVRAYLRSPKGRQNIEKAKRMARDPRNRAKARSWLDRWRSRRH